MKRAAVLALLAVPAIFAPDARAYESECRVTRGVGQQALEDSICSEAPQCDNGLDAARGAQLGEHTWLTRDAMIRAGLDGFADTEQLFDYFSDDHPAAPGFKSVEPTGGGAMLHHVDRPYTIPELAQLPDWSYAMHDFLTGNEHCPVAGLARSTPKDAALCHNRLHIGSMNSTHFAPQSREAYAHYHAIALAVAQRCKAIALAFPEASTDPTLPVNPLTSYLQIAVIPACEKEALAFEAIGSHYLGDAWSEGHMWQRWGSPRFAQSTRGYCGDAGVSLAAGLIHGFGSVVWSWVGSKLYRDDQLCLPGPYDRTTNAIDDANPESWPAQFVDSDGAVHDGGGDHYLLACTPTQNATNGWSITQSEELSFEYRRATTCIGLGFREIYDAGPRTLGDTPAQGTFDPAVTSSLDPACWNQRATNRSMYLATGISSIPTSRSPEFTALLVPLALSLSAIPAGEPMCAAKLAVSNEYRAALTKYAFWAELNATLDPMGTDTADLNYAKPDIFGLRPNEAYVGDVDHVEYFEPRDPASWTPKRLPVPCASDADCSQSMYCAVADASGGRTCAPNETANLEAFRTAELPAWCTFDTVDTLTAQAAACAAAPGGDACDACVRMVKPHLANACDAGSYSARVHALDDTDDRMLDHRSICQAAGDASLVAGAPALLYRPYDADAVGAADAEAMKFCLAGQPIAADTFTYQFQDAWPASPEGDFHDAPFVMIENTCGAGIGEQRKRFTHQAFPEEHTHLLVLKPQAITGADGVAHKAPVAELSVTLYQGPACTQVIATGVPVSSTGGSDPDEIDLTWTIPAATATEVCLRVKALQPTTWSGYRIAEPGKAVVVSAGSGYTCALTSTGGVKCWGQNDKGQLGDGTTTQRNNPVDVVGLTSGVVALSTGWDHTCALTSIGGVKCWGYNMYGQLGDGTTTTRLTPVDVMGLSSVAVALSAGGAHTCVVTAVGGVKCWGLNASGELGNGTTMNQSAPINVSGLTSGVVAVSNGQAHTCAVTSAGGVKCWGDNYEGQLGDGTGTNRLTPVDVSGLTSGVTVVSGGFYHTCAVTSAGGVKCWGFDNKGQLGDGLASYGSASFTPVDVVGLTSGAVAVSAGYDHSCALTSTGAVKCWGDNLDGALGDGTTTSRLVPVDTVGLSPGITIVSTGWYDTCAMTSAGVIMCWGLNYEGQLGDGTTTIKLTPVSVGF